MPRQYLTPGGSYLNEGTTQQFLIPGGPFVNIVSAAPSWPFDESVRPNAVSNMLNLTGAYTDIDDDPSAPDSLWLVKT